MEQQVLWVSCNCLLPQRLHSSLTGLWRSVEAARRPRAVRSGPEIDWRRWRDAPWWLCLIGSSLRSSVELEILCASQSSPVPAPVSTDINFLDTHTHTHKCRAWMGMINPNYDGNFWGGSDCPAGQHQIYPLRISMYYAKHVFRWAVTLRALCWTPLKRAAVQYA